MPVPSAITDLSTSESLNSPPGSETLGANMDNYLRAAFAFIAQLRDGTGLAATASLSIASLTLSGNLTVQGNTTLGNASGDTLTVHPNAVTWSNNPTHSGNHTFGGNLVVNGGVQFGDAAGDAFTVSGAACSWPNNPTHSGNHTFSGNLTVSGETRLNGNTYIGNQSTDTLAIEPLVVSLPNGSLTISGPLGLALNGATTDPYGGFSVTRPNNANAYSYFSMTRAGQAAFGMGINTSNEIWIGTPTAGANGVLSGTPWLRLNGTQGYINGQLVWHAGNDGGLTLAASQVTSGTFADARIAQSNVTQHQTALAIACSQITAGTFADARVALSNVTQFYTSGHAASGYQTLPTGLILQWGTTSSIGAGGSASVSFPIAFPAACYTVVSTANGVGGSAQAESYVTSIGTSSFTQVNAGTTSKAFKWFAIGK